MTAFKSLIVVAFALVLTACGTTQIKTTTNDFNPTLRGKTLLIKPDVELKVLMASGMSETRADWSKQGEANLEAALMAALRSYGGDVEAVSLDQNMSEKQNQLIKLNDAVLSTSLNFDYSGRGLPTHKDAFRRSIGPGAVHLAQGKDADYALMIKAAGSYSSGGKVAMNIAMAALGGPVQTGGQQLFASFVDLKTGDIVWSNYARAASNADMRDAGGAQVLVDSVLKDFPLRPAKEGS